MKLVARLKLARVHRPAGTLLTLWPAMCGLSLAPSAALLPSPSLACTFVAGAVFARGAGCVINDLWDRRVDARVARTALRPLASGVLSVREGLSTLAVFGGLAVACLVPLNAFARTIALAAVVPIALYPAFKRFTHWPQAMLGVTFNLGALIGYAAVANSLSLSSALLYGGCVCWTLSYDTVYAHQDKRDDAVVGVRSTALLGDSSVIPVAGAAAAAALWSSALVAQFGSPLAALAAVPAGATSLWLARADLSSPEACDRAFRRSAYWVGPLLWGGVLTLKWSEEVANAIANYYFV